MGITIRQVVEDIGGGIAGGRRFKAVLIGGPSGGCLPESLIDTPIDYESLVEKGAIMGSGGLVVLDDGDCMVDIAKYFLSFCQHESCGRCTFCCVGTRRLQDILERLTEGDGQAGDLEELERLSGLVKSASQCGLGKTAPNPVITTLAVFPRRVRGPPPRPLPGRRLQEPDPLRDPGQLHRAAPCAPSTVPWGPSPGRPTRSTASTRPFVRVAMPAGKSVRAHAVKVN